MAEIKDGDRPSINQVGAPPIAEIAEQRKPKGNVKKKRRRGKTKRRIISKGSVNVSWPDRRKYDKSKRNYRFRKMVLANTHAPFNNNQFLMEIHKPDSENNLEIFRTPSARTRDSSFSVDSEDNYFFSLPDDEEEYQTKEFSSVYEDAQCERLANMPKSDLIQEYLLLEVKYENLIKRTERCKPKSIEDDTDNLIDRDTSVTDKESITTERITSAATMNSVEAYDQSVQNIMQRMNEQEDQIRELQIANEKLRLENEKLRQRSQSSSSEDSESDSSSTSVSGSSSCSVPERESIVTNGNIDSNTTNGVPNSLVCDAEPQVNGFHNPDDPVDDLPSD